MTTKENYFNHKIINHGVLVPFPFPPLPTQFGQAGPPQEADIIMYITTKTPIAIKIQIYNEI